MQIQGTADPFWKELREQLAQNSLEVAAQLPKAFGAGAAAGEPACAVPSFIVTAMVKGLASGQFSRLLQSRVLEALCCIVHALVAAGDSLNCLSTPRKVCHMYCTCTVLTNCSTTSVLFTTGVHRFLLDIKTPFCTFCYSCRVHRSSTRAWHCRGMHLFIAR